MSVVFLVVVASHQLTPYVVAGSAMGLVAFGLVRSYRIIPILVGLSIGYLVPRYEVAEHYGGLISGFNIFGNILTSGAATDTASSAGRALSVDATMVVALIVWGLSALAVVSAWRRLGPVAVPGLLAFAPFCLVLAQNYGGEAIFRVYLFSAPWCAILVAGLLLRRRWLPRFAAEVAGVLAFVVVVLGTTQAASGQVMATIFTRDDVAIARYAYANAEPGSVIVLAAGNLPTRMTANYWQIFDEYLIGADARLGTFELTDAGADVLDQHFDDKVVTYLVFSSSMTRFLDYYQYMPADTLTALERQIQGSPRWEFVYRIGDGAVYRRAPNQRPA
jgi:hypothetical protein